MNVVVIGWRRHGTVIQKRRDDQIGAGRWEFPGGKMEEFETPELALIREFREEVGLEVRPVELLDYQIP